MTLSSFVFFLVSFFLFLFQFPIDANIVIVSRSDVTYDFNGQQATKQRVQFICTNQNECGDIAVGTKLIHVCCEAPYVNYKLQEQIRIPQEIRLVWDRACLVENVDAFVAALTVDDSIFEDGGAGSTPGGRRLLQAPGGAAAGGSTKLSGKAKAGIGAQAAGTAIALALSVWNTIEIQSLKGSVSRAWDKLYAIDDNMVLINKSLNKIVDWQKNQQAYDVQNNYQWGNQTNLNSLLLAGLANASAAINATNENQRRFIQGVNSKFDDVQAESRDAIIYIQQNFNAGQTALRESLIRLSNNTERGFGAVQDQINKIANSQIQSEFGQQLIGKQLIELIQEVQFKNLLTSAIFSHIDAMPDRFFPLFTEQGQAPSQLTGIELRTIYDEIHLNFISTPPNANPSSVYRIYHYEIRFYLHTEFAMANLGANFPNWRSVFSSLGPGEDCMRPYVNSNEDPDPFNKKQCEMWIEINKESCAKVIENTGVQKGDFDWSQADPSLLPNQQPTQLQRSYCIDDIEIETPIVIRSMPALIDWESQSICQARGTNGLLYPNYKYQMASHRMNMIGYFEGAEMSSCGMGIDQLFTHEITTGNSPLLLNLMHMMWAVRQLNAADVLIARAKKYGRIPGGIKVNTEPWVHIPGGSNGTIDAAAVPSKCLQAEYLVASRETLEVNSLQALRGANGKYIQQRVTVQVDNNIPCAENDLNCFEVENEHITVDIPINLEYPFPLEPMLFAGSFDPARAKSLGMFDVPTELLSIDNNPFARNDKVTYYKMPAGTLQTLTVPEFKLQNSGIFKPEMGAVSPWDYRSPLLLDTDGFVLCDIQGGIIDNLNTTKVEKCSLGMKYTNGSDHYELCSQFEQKTLLFNKLNDGIHQSNYGSTSIGSSMIMTSKKLFSHWFQAVVPTTLGSEEVVFSMNGKYLNSSGTNAFWRFIVDQDGIPGVVLSRSSSSNSNNTILHDTRERLNTGNLRDGFIHHIVWQVDSQNIVGDNFQISYTLYVDNMMIGTYTADVGSHLFGTIEVRDARLDFPAYQNPNGISTADIIEFGLISYPTTSPELLFLRSRIADMYSCHLALIRQRCKSTDEVENILLGMREDKSIQCGGTVLASTLSITPSSLPSSVFQFPSSPFSVGFWLRVPKDESSSLIGANYITYLTLTHTRHNITVALVPNGLASRVRIYFNDQVVSSVNVFQTSGAESHHGMLVVNPAGPAVSFYLDGVLINSASIIQSIASAPVQSSFIQIWSDYLFMVTYYNSVLSVNEIITKMNCQLSSEDQLVANYIAPIGYCVLSMNDPNIGYCRHPSLCDGHCTALSSISNQVFTTSARICDVGYQGADCLSICEAVNANGECYDYSGGFANGITVGGKVCSLAKHFQMYENTNAGVVIATSREYLYTPTIDVPTGQLVVLVGGTAVCPTYSLASLGDGTSVILLSNTQSQQASIRVVFYPWEYGATPEVCESLCCNFDQGGLPVSIQPNGQESVLIPTCGSTTVEISIETALNVFTSCNRFTGSSFLTSVASSGANLPVSIQNQVIIRVDQATTNLYNVYQQLAIQQNQLLYMLAQEFNASAGIRNTIGQIGNILNTVHPSNWTFPNATATDIVPGFDAEIDRISERLDDFNTKLNNANDLNNALVNGNSGLVNITENGFRLVNETVQSLLEYSFGLALQLAIRNPGFGAGLELSKYITGIVNGALGAIKDAVDAGKGLFGSLFGGIGGILDGLLTFILYALLAFGAYKAYQAYSEYSKKNKEKESNSETPRSKKPGMVNGSESMRLTGNQQEIEDL